MLDSGHLDDEYRSLKRNARLDTGVSEDDIKALLGPRLYRAVVAESIFRFAAQLVRNGARHEYATMIMAEMLKRLDADPDFGGTA